MEGSVTEAPPKTRSRPPRILPAASSPVPPRARCPLPPWPPDPGHLPSLVPDTSSAGATRATRQRPRDLSQG